MSYLPQSKLLSEYFLREDLQEACRILDEPTSYRNNELISIIRKEWVRHGNDKYDLFDILDRPILSRICQAYNIDGKGSKDILLKRIRKKKLLEDSKRNLKISGGVGGGLIVLILALYGAGIDTIGVVSDILGQNNNQEEIPIESISEEKENEAIGVLPHVDVWKTYKENRPYTLQWTMCSFGSEVSPEGEKSWSFSMKPILINKNNEPALIPFNISYYVSYDKVIDGKSFSILGTTSERSQKHLVNPPEREVIKFHNFNQALIAALEEGSTIVQIIKSKSSFDPYSEQIDDNLLDEFESDREDYLAAQFAYDENTETWSETNPKEALCSNTYET